MRDTITDRGSARGLRMTGPRRTIARVPEMCADHPDVVALSARAPATTRQAAIVTRDRTVEPFETTGTVETHDDRLIGPRRVLSGVARKSGT